MKASNCNIASLLMLAVATMAIGMAIPNTGTAKAQAESPERFWLAGRYDGNRVIIYFGTVQFNGTLAQNASKIAPAVVDGFFSPVEISTKYISGLERKPDAERFSVGDQYDLLLGNGATATITLTKLVGCETDEGVGNDSFIGAIAAVTGKDALLFTNGYYAVRRHAASSEAVRKLPRKIETRFAYLSESPAPFDIVRRVMALLNERLKTMATDDEKRAMAGLSPELSVQTFHLADGSMRYYARAIWMPQKVSPKNPPFAAGAWLAASPELRILAMEPDTDGYADLLPALRNVVDLGGNRTGMIVSVSRGETISLDLIEYQDGRRTDQMRKWQSISFGE